MKKTFLLLSLFCFFFACKKENTTTTNTEDEIFLVVEQQAEFPNGQAALFQWLKDNMQYPETAKQNKVEGKIITRFVIEKNGDLNGATVLRGVDASLDKEALRLLSTMPKWKPGKQRGNDVRSYFTLPVEFKLP